MAEFSKQWLEFTGESNGVWNFDIEEIASSIQNDHYSPCICEGFGFVAIGKNDMGEIILAYRNIETSMDEIRWKTLEETINTLKDEI